MVNATDFKQYGWICPVCGRGLSPWTHVCPCYDEIKKIATSPSTTGEAYYTQLGTNYTTSKAPVTSMPSVTYSAQTVQEDVIRYRLGLEPNKGVK